MSLIGDAVTLIADFVASQLGGGSGSLSASDVQALERPALELARITDDTFQAADVATHASDIQSKSAGDQITVIGLNLKQITAHTYDVVIPGSMSWLRGYMLLHIIDPIRKDVATAQHDIHDINVWRGKIDRWQNGYVDPAIQQWQGFLKYFQGWPIQALNTLHDWLQHADHFAAFATPAIARPIVSYWSSSDHTTLRDDLVQMMLQASPDRYRYAVGAFEAMLDQDWP